jgi:hypothetical protein
MSILIVYNIGRYNKTPFHLKTHFCLIKDGYVRGRGHILIVFEIKSLRKVESYWQISDWKL